MSLQKLCEPIFQYICRLNRAARKGASHGQERVRTELKTLFEQIAAQASEDAQLAKQYEKIELPLIFFVDFMIKESALEWGYQWEELAYERNQVAGDQQFFEMLDETLADRSAEAAERLMIFYQCIGLGFTGAYIGQHELLRSKMLECSSRIGEMADPEGDGLICTEAYQGVDKSNLIEHPGKKLGAITIALVVLVLTLFAVNIILYRTYSADLRADLDRISTHTPWAQPPGSSRDDPGN